MDEPYKLNNDSLSLNYQKMKLAYERFSVNLQELNNVERRYIDDLAAKAITIQERICGAPEALVVCISDKDVANALKEIVEQCGDIYQFELMLKKYGLNEQQMSEILSKELLCDAVLESISVDLPQLDAQDAQRYYQENLDKFSRKRTWKVSQILITINSDYPENHFTPARKRINDIYETVSLEMFSQLALRHSECPSAVEGGELGWCEQGKLFPEIEAVLQWLPKGVVSAPIQTEMGFHLLLCHEERPERVADFSEAYPSIKALHDKRARHYIQKQWLQKLAVKHGDQ
ncbi:peptidylprolyl isomerase [Vibrio sp. FNV 38]|nr:peptidylprolyl isomerase [Vibrio sp. FNV 38]